MAMENFGLYVNNLRIKKGLTLREFCRRLVIDASNWSKVERGISPPPKSKKVLREMGKILGLKENSEELLTLYDLAAIGHVPTELISDQSIVDKLPIFFRTARGGKPTREEMQNLIKILKSD